MKATPHECAGTLPSSSSWYSWQNPTSTGLGVTARTLPSAASGSRLSSLGTGGRSEMRLWSAARSAATVLSTRAAHDDRGVCERGDSRPAAAWGGACTLKHASWRRRRCGGGGGGGEAGVAGVGGVRALWDSTRGGVEGELDNDDDESVSGVADTGAGTEVGSEVESEEGADDEEVEVEVEEEDEEEPVRERLLLVALEVAELLGMAARVPCQ